MWSVKFSIIFLALYFCSCNAQNETLDSNNTIIQSPNTYFNYTGNINRIVGGVPLNIIQVPFQVALYKNGNLECGGSIISADWILTAAHCLRGGGNFVIRAGSRLFRRGGIIGRASLAIINSNFNPNTMANDIGLLKLRGSLKWSRRVRPVRLATPQMTLPKQFLVSGWGVLRETQQVPSNVLRGALVKHVALYKCQNQYKFYAPITRLQICAAAPAKDACQGDSGGPLTYKGIQYGVVSYGIGCARPGYSGVYTNVRKQHKWIRNAIKRNGGAMPM